MAAARQAAASNNSQVAAKVEVPPRHVNVVSVVVARRIRALATQPPNSSSNMLKVVAKEEAISHSDVDVLHASVAHSLAASRPWTMRPSTFRKIRTHRERHDEEAAVVVVVAEAFVEVLTEVVAEVVVVVRARFDQDVVDHSALQVELKAEAAMTINSSQTASIRERGERVEKDHQRGIIVG